MYAPVQAIKFSEDLHVLSRVHTGGNLGFSPQVNMFFDLLCILLPVIFTFFTFHVYWDRRLIGTHCAFLHAHLNVK